MGRHTKLTPERAQRIISLVRDGNYFSTACEASGISPDTGFEWLRRGGGADSQRPSTPLYAQFALDIKRAEAEAEIAAVGAVRAAWDNTWPSAMTYLERKHPAKWARREVPAVSTEQALAQMRAWQQERAILLRALQQSPEAMAQAQAELEILYANSRQTNAG